MTKLPLNGAIPKYYYFITFFIQKYERRRKSCIDPSSYAKVMLITKFLKDTIRLADTSRVG